MDAARKSEKEIEQTATEFKEIEAFKSMFLATGMWKLVSIKYKVEDMKLFYVQLEAFRITNGGISIRYNGVCHDIRNNELARLLGMEATPEDYIDIDIKEIEPMAAEELAAVLHFAPDTSLKAMFPNERLSYGKLKEDRDRCYYSQFTKRLMSLSGYHHINAQRVTVANKVKRGNLHPLAVFKAGLARGKKEKNGVPPFPSLQGFHLAYLTKLHQEAPKEGLRLQAPTPQVRRTVSERTVKSVQKATSAEPEQSEEVVEVPTTIPIAGENVTSSKQKELKDAVWMTHEEREELFKAPTPRSRTRAEYEQLLTQYRTLGKVMMEESKQREEDHQKTQQLLKRVNEDRQEVKKENEKLLAQKEESELMKAAVKKSNAHIAKLEEERRVSTTQAMEVSKDHRIYVDRLVRDHAEILATKEELWTEKVERTAKAVKDQVYQKKEAIAEMEKWREDAQAQHQARGELRDTMIQLKEDTYLLYKKYHEECPPLEREGKLLMTVESVKSFEAKASLANEKLARARELVSNHEREKQMCRQLAGIKDRAISMFDHLSNIELGALQQEESSRELATMLVGTLAEWDPEEGRCSITPAQLDAIWDLFTPIVKFRMSGMTQSSTIKFTDEADLHRRLGGKANGRMVSILLPQVFRMADNEGLLEEIEEVNRMREEWEGFSPAEVEHLRSIAIIDCLYRNQDQILESWAEMEAEGDTGAYTIPRLITFLHQGGMLEEGFDPANNKDREVSDAWMSFEALTLGEPLHQLAFSVFYQIRRLPYRVAHICEGSRRDRLPVSVTELMAGAKTHSSWWDVEVPQPHVIKWLEETVEDTLLESYFGPRIHWPTPGHDDVMEEIAATLSGKATVLTIQAWDRPEDKYFCSPWLGGYDLLIRLSGPNRGQTAMEKCISWLLEVESSPLYMQELVKPWLFRFYCAIKSLATVHTLTRGGLQFDDACKMADGGKPFYNALAACGPHMAQMYNWIVKSRILVGEDPTLRAPRGATAPVGNHGEPEDEKMEDAPSISPMAEAEANGEAALTEVSAEEFQRQKLTSKKRRGRSEVAEASGPSSSRPRLD